MGMLRTIKRRVARSKRPYSGSEGKRAKKLDRRARKVISYARWVTGTLLRATGRAAETVHLPKLQDQYHENIYLVGTTITPNGVRPSSFGKKS